MEEKRGFFASRIGFILATAGSAIGLGNLWKFPYMTGQNGGFLFILMSVICVALIGIPVMMGEMSIGRHGRKNPVGSYKAINKKGGVVGFIGIAVAFIILSYYSVIGGWIIKYLVTYITGGLHGADSGAFFVSFISSPVEPIIWHLIFMAIVVGICFFGVSNGLEKASKIMMPSLFAIVVIICIRAVTLPNASAGLAFLFKPNFEKIASPELYIGALSQTFFSLSLGMGAIVTYGSYMNKDENITKSAFIVSGLDLFIAILASVAIMPIIFSAGMEPSAGPGLIFASLPVIFENMTMGIVLAVLFFILVLFAAVTSAMSLLETTTSYTMDEFKWSRTKSVLILGAVIFLCGVPSSLSQGILADKTIMGMSFLDFLSFLTDNIMLPVSAFCMCIFISRVWTFDKAKIELTNGGKLKVKFLSAWKYLISYIAPVAIVVVFVYGLIPYFK